ncbi:MAG TPA: efflux RND transporter permease subunit [Polyangiaceae bacterium]|nr:efflux RND transporter permease subunit [Polyangiaceae bacterium]
MTITEVCVKRPVLAWMIMLATIVFGIVAVQRIGVSQMPDVDFPTISVSVTWEGAAPEVMENDVVQVLEDALAQVEGAKSLTATSRQGSAQITVELDLSRNVDLALQDVQTKIAQAQRTLPRDLDPPVVSKTNPEDQPILWVAVSGPFTRQLITDYARYQVRQKLQTVPGVGEVMMGGYVDRNVRVWLDANKMDQRGVAVADVMAALQREHVELPAGRIEGEGREIDVRVLGEALNLAEMRRITVRNVGTAPVYLSDVALVEDGFADIRSTARASGQTAQGLGIKKQRGANTVAVAKAVRRALEDVRRAMPEGMRADVMFDSSSFVEASVADIEHELGLAVILTALVCWMFLGSFSSTMNVVLAIPMSLFGTLAVIYFMGFTLNTFSLLAMALAVGIVVDDAIMVMENIFRHREEGKGPEEAAIEGTHEIRFAALAATAAICAIFMPVIFMQGIIGKFFYQFGVTLSLSVVFSYVEAITLAPARCAQFLKKQAHEGGRSWLGRGVDAAFEGLRRVYARTLGWGLKRPALVLLGTLVFLGGSVSAFRSLPGEFVPSQDQSRLMVRLQSAVGSSLEEMDGLMKKAEGVVNSRPDVLRSFAVIGGNSGPGVNTGMMFITMQDKRERTITQSELMGILRKQINQIPGMRGVVMDLSQQGFSAKRGFPVEFSVRGSDWNKLIAAADEAKRRLAQTGTVVDLDTDYQLGMPELRIVPDRARISDLGLSVEEVAQAVNVLVGGTRSGKFNADGRRVDVRVRLLADQRSRPESLEHLKLRTPRGELVPLASLIKKEEHPAAQSITRLDRERAISIYGNVAPTSSQDKALAAVESIGKHMPAGTRIVLGGSSVAFRESMQSLTFALLLGIIVAFMVLAAQFNSLLHPITVLTILPLSIAGAAFGLLLAHQSVNIFSMIGVLLLMGIAKKNSIILVDYANRLRERGLDPLSAMREAGPVRLRPILMTSIATLMAAVPAALGLGEGSETRVPMAVAVIGGLLVSTALSLYVVPAFYVLAERIIGFFGRIFSRSGSPPAPLARPSSSA